MKKSDSLVLSLFAIAAFCAGSARASGQANPAPAQSQHPSNSYADRSTDIGLNVYQTFTSNTTGMGVVQKPTNSLGGMFEIRHIQNPFVGYELSYSYHPSNVTIGPAPAPSCGLSCNTPAQSIPDKISTVGLNWIVSKRFGVLRPFAAGGLGFYINEPSYSLPVGEPNILANHNAVNDVVRMAWLYGGGVDVSLTQHFGIRGQYRAMVYKAPNLSYLFPAQGVFTQTRMPMGGVFYKF